MVGRKSERSKKSVNYSKFSAVESEDDDFADPTPPRKKKTRKLDKSEEETQTDKINTVKPERKSRNRLSEEEKYQQELEAALKISLITTKTSLGESQDDKTSIAESVATSDFATPPQSLDSKPIQSSCTVQADVLPSPNTKLMMNSKTKSNIERRKRVIINEAASKEDDFIVCDPIEENEETGRRKSDRRRKIIKEKEEDEYKMSDESESDDETPSPDELSDESDYEEAPKKKTKPKKQNITSSKRTKTSEKCSAAKVGAVKSSTLDRLGKENKLSPTKSVMTSPIKPSLDKAETGRKSTNCLPITPKTSSNFLPKRSPAASMVGKSPIILNKPGKFIQPGWTPPGPAGSKSNVLKSPNIIRRVGLSRNVRLTPLHPKVGIK